MMGISNSETKILFHVGEQKETTGTYIYKNTDITPAWAYLIIKRLKEKGLLNIKKEGSRNLISLTDKGNKYYKLIKEVMKDE